MSEDSKTNLNPGSIPFIILLMAIVAAVVYGNTGDGMSAAVWAGGVGAACVALPFLLLIIAGVIAIIAHMIS